MADSSPSNRSVSAAAWLRSAHLAICAFLIVSSVSGLCYVFYSAFVGHALGAIIGALIAVGGISLGLVAFAAIRFGELVLARTDPLEKLMVRMDALESAFEAQGVPVDLARVAAADPEHLVAANLQHDAFPRLVRTEPAEPVNGKEAHRAGASAALELEWQSAYQNGDVAGCRRALDALRSTVEPARIARMEEGLRAMSEARSAQLREDFARLVRTHNFEAALVTGEEIARAFPDSSMARQFESIRPHLQRRIQSS